MKSCIIFQFFSNKFDFEQHERENYEKNIQNVHLLKFSFKAYRQNILWNIRKHSILAFQRVLWVQQARFTQHTRRKIHVRESLSCVVVEELCNIEWSFQLEFSARCKNIQQQSLHNYILLKEKSVQIKLAIGKAATKDQLANSWGRKCWKFLYIRPENFNC